MVARSCLLHLCTLDALPSFPCVLDGHAGAAAAAFQQARHPIEIRHRQIHLENSAMNQNSLKPGLSRYLDLFRLTLALTVVVFHASIPQMGGSWFKFPFGHIAVVGFFVLSGFVISYVAATKESDAASYGAARLARLWSVLIPALALTPVFDAIGRMFSPAVYEGWGIWLGFDHPFFRLAAAAAFLNEIWFWSITPLSNGPVWSLGFEAWFYALFGAFIFSRGWKRVGLVCLVGLIAGPKILLLFPSWLLGVWLYSSRKKIKIGRSVGIVLFAACPVLIVAIKGLHADVCLLNITQRMIDPHFLETYLKFARLSLAKSRWSFGNCPSRRSNGDRG
jgi:peptidoglycan/LPS O-acetylase OafA/YrhL